MEKIFMCPRTEICYVYKIYSDITKDDKLGVIKTSSIEFRDYYSCKALTAVEKLADEGKLPETVAGRLQGILDCLLIDQANKLVEKHRPDS